MNLAYTRENNRLLFCFLFAKGEEGGVSTVLFSSTTFHHVSSAKRLVKSESALLNDVGNMAEWLMTLDFILPR